MIVRRHNGSIVLIRQVDHSVHSADFARQWGNGQFERPVPHESVVLAAVYHDEGWRERDDQPLFDPARQGPLHWRDISVQDHLRFYPLGAQRAQARDPYAALLASMHASGIYTRRYGTAPVRMTKLGDDVSSLTQTFVADQELLQATLKRMVWDPAQRRSEFERRLWFHYELLQIWDRLSLFVCLTDLDHPAEERIGPAPVSLDGAVVVEFLVRATGKRRITIDPYPFASPELVMEVPARVIPDRPYASLEALQLAVRAAREEPIRCRVVAA